MARIILTTCGTSVYQSSCWKGLTEQRISGVPPDQSDEVYTRRMKSEGTIREYQRKDNSGETLAGDFDMDSWNRPEYLRDLPAELASLKAIDAYCNNRASPLQSMDRLILLHSNDSEGIFCASLIGKVLTKNYLLPMQTIIPQQIDGLDPNDGASFSRALLNIWKIWCETICEDEEGPQYIFNLTGGYKGAVIVLGALAYKMRDNVQIRVFYLHESAAYDGIAIMGFENDALVTAFYNTQSNIYREYKKYIGDISVF